MSKNKAIVTMIAASLCWSIAGLFIKQIPWHPLVIAGFRSLIAGLFMSLVFIKEKKHFSRQLWLGGVIYIFVAGLFVIANKLTTSTNAILLQFTAPIWVMVISSVFLKQKARPRDILAIVSVMFGMVLFFMGDLEVGNIIGNFIAILAGVAVALMILLMSGSKEVNPSHITIIGNYMLFIVSVPFIFAHPPAIDFKSITNIVILGVFQLGMGYLLFTKAVRYVSSLEASLIMVVEPLFNPIWVLLFVGEKPTVYAVLGGIVVVTAIVIHQVVTAKIEKNKLKKQYL